MTYRTKDGIYVRAWKGMSERFVAEAKREPFVYSPDGAVFEPGTVWFEFADTEADAIDAVLADVRSSER